MPANDRNSQVRVSAEFIVVNKYGIHARPSTLIVRMVARHEVAVTIENGRNRVSGSSVLGLMGLAASQGTRIRVMAEGDGADGFLKEFGTLIASGFGEE